MRFIGARISERTAILTWELFIPDLRKAFTNKVAYVPCFLFHFPSLSISLFVSLRKCGLSAPGYVLFIPYGLHIVVAGRFCFIPHLLDIIDETETEP